MQKLILRLTYSVFVRWFLRLIVGIQFGDSRFLEDEEQFIIVANHNSHLDTMSLMASVPGKLIHKIRPVAAQDHFGKTKLMEALSNYFINTLLIQRKRDRENPGNDPINKMLKALDEGYSLILFPEGTRGEPEKQQPLKPGVALILSQRPNISYIPVFMKGMGKAMPKGDGLIVPTVSTLTYGRPTKVSEAKTSAILSQIRDDFEALENGSYHRDEV